MLDPPTVRSEELQPKGLGQRLLQIADEVGHEEQQLLLEALEAVVPVGTDEVLQARPVPLARPPREAAHRPTPGRLDLGEIPYRAGDRGTAEAPCRGPPVAPAGCKLERLPVGVEPRVEASEIAQVTGIGP